MPVLPHAKKALRASKRKATYNAPVKAHMRNAVKKFRKEPTEANLKEAYSAIDRALKRNIVHHNKAARLKSRLAKLLPQEKTSATKSTTKAKSKTTKKTTKKTATTTKKAQSKPKSKKATKAKATKK